MNNKENCTKGPVQTGGYYVYSDGSTEVNESGRTVSRSIATVTTHDKEPGIEPVLESTANAELIAEAFNTLHTSGFTPAELYDQLQRALDKLRAIEPIPPTLSESST